MTEPEYVNDQANTNSNDQPYNAKDATEEAKETRESENKEPTKIEQTPAVSAYITETTTRNELVREYIAVEEQKAKLHERSSNLHKKINQSDSKRESLLADVNNDINSVGQVNGKGLVFPPTGKV